MRGIIAALIFVFGAAIPAQAEQGLGPSFSADKKVVNTPKQRSAPNRKPATADSVATSTPLSGAVYKIGPQDVIEISVFNVPELSKTLQVADSGVINYPLIGEIPAAGRTPEELERDLTARLGAVYLQAPVVTVFMKEYNSQRVVLSGAVVKPGVYPISSEMSLLQLVALGGGFTETADSTVLVIRAENGKRAAARFDVSAIEAGRAKDPIIQGNDRVVAGTSAIKTTFGTILKALPVAGMFALF